MNFAEIKKILSAKIIVEPTESLDVLTGCGADLMSDVLAFTKEKTVLLTGLTNPQVIRTAEMTDLVMVVFVRGKKPPEATIKLAKEKKVPLLVTDKPLYESCGLLYEAGLKAETLSKLE